MEQTASTNRTPIDNLGSILAAAPVSPARRVKAALLLDPRVDEADACVRGLADHLHLDRSILATVLHLRKPGRNIWPRVAEALGVDLADLRPDMVEGGSDAAGQAGCSALSS